MGTTPLGLAIHRWVLGRLGSGRLMGTEGLALVGVFGGPLGFSWHDD